MLKLTVTNGPDRGKSLDLETGKSYVVGCNEDADLFLSDPMVLKSHCVVTAGENHAVIRNNTANAGTFVGDKKISQAKIRGNTSFRLGESTVKMTIVAGPDPLLGKIIKGYKLNEVVGEGGMGKVYRATQLSLHRDVALKVLRESLAKDKSFRDLFVHEARAAAQLVHPNVVQVYDAGSEGDIVFFSMEFIARGSVEEILADGPIPWEEAILMVLEAAHGLEYAEGKGIVHRDIKPDNLMINADGRVKIADLGLAKRGEAKKDQGIIGTPHFIPPEQALGKDVDTRADLYSLGATFFRMVTGKTLFTGKTAKEIVLKHIKEPPPAASSVNKDIPDDLEVVFAKMLAKDPDHRYQTATECIKALEEVCAHHGIKGSIIRRGVGKRVLIPVIVLLLGAVGAAIHFGTQDPVQLEDEVARREAKEARERELQAQRDREAAEQRTRKLEVAGELRALREDEFKLRLNRSPPEATYDVKEDAPALERDWKEMAKAYEKFAERDDAKEFELSVEAAGYAAAIRRTLQNAEKAAEDKQAKIQAKLAEVKKIDEGLRDTLTKLKSSDKWESAYRLCATVGADEPGKDDPFAPVETWVWVNPFDAGDKVPATKIKPIMKAIEASRKHFKSEGGRIERQARSRWDEIKKGADALDPIGQASDAQIQQVIDTLEGVVRNFPDDAGAKVTKIRECANEADALARKLRKELRDREKARIMEDRALVSNAQRKRASLEPDQLPNQVMHCEFAAAINEWTKTLEELQTPRYKAFVEERIAMLRWCQYLLGQFHLDSRNAAAVFTTDKLVLPLPDDKDRETELSKPTDSPTEFTTKYRYKGNSQWKLETFPMDWIYHGLFHHKGQPRWKDVTPALRFALGAFAFETMQYKQAKEQFDALAADDRPGADRYHAVARALAVRSEMEKQARDDWEAICAARKTLKSSDEAKRLMARANNFYKQHEGTIFYLDVKPRDRVLGADFHDDTKTPEIPKAPPP